MRTTNAALEPRRSSPWMISKAKNVANKSVSWMISGSNAVEGARRRDCEWARPKSDNEDEGKRKGSNYVVCLRCHPYQNT